MRIPRALFAGAMGCCLAIALLASPAEAQFLGHNFTGDMGLMAGTQAPPGWNLAVVYLRFDGETLRDRDGNSITLDPEERGSLDVNSYALALEVLQVANRPRIRAPDVFRLHDSSA